MKEKTEEITNSVKDSGEDLPTETVAQPAEEKPVDEKESREKKPPGKTKKADLLKKVKEFEEEAKKNYDLYLRAQAEIENTKKRNKKEKEDWIKYSNETLIKEILPVIDNLEQAVAHCEDKNSLDALREGVELTLKGLKNALSKSGLEEVKAKGVPFDPCLHKAVSEMEDENAEAGIILQELQRGYTLNQRLVRPATVVVCKADPDKSTTSSDETPEQEACEK